MPATSPAKSATKRPKSPPSSSPLSPSLISSQLASKLSLKSKPIASSASSFALRREATSPDAKSNLKSQRGSNSSLFRNLSGRKKEGTEKNAYQNKWTIEEVLKLRTPTPKFLVPFSNTTPIQFLEFRIRELKTNTVLFEVKRPSPDTQMTMVLPGEGSHGAGEVFSETAANVNDGEDMENLDDYRIVHYNFGPAFLDYEEIGTTLVFQVGSYPINNFRMIEKLYFKDKLLKSYDFDFGFCIPNSVNNWESLYVFPKLSPSLQKEMVENPCATTSDSFYFIDNELVMHNKATYEFS